MQKNMVKKILCAVSILAIAAFTAGCDDDSSDRRHAHRHHHNPPPHHRPHHQDRDHRHHKPHREKCSNLVGEYSATALNDASASKGSTYNVDIFEDEGGKLYLGLPDGSDYPISIENGAGEVAGGTITQQADGNFVYKDKLGGMWLVEKNR